MKNERLVIFASIFIVLFLAERLFPLRRRKSSQLGRFVINMAMTGIALTVGSFVVRNAALNTSEWGLAHSWSAVVMESLPGWVRIVTGILLMDMTFYFWHRANHRISLLWRFHNVHHIDPDMDVSTSFRFHFVEILYSTVFRVLQVLVLGLTPVTYVTYEIFFTSATMFHHSNVRLPLRIERLVNKVIVTPRMHGVHHSAVMKETNSNYSVIFCWWDMLCKSLILNVPQSVINVGVPGYQSKGDNRFWNLLIMPFTRQRNYWYFPDGTWPKSNKVHSHKSNTMLE